MPLSEKEIRDAESRARRARADPRASSLPVQFVPTLIAALQENMRIFSESQRKQPVPTDAKGPVP